jgi:C-terminal processing protease CtpA/Prc
MYGNLLISYLIEARLHHKIIYFKKNKNDNNSASGKYYIDPNNKILYSGNVIVLTNRACYSATNGFVSALSQLPNVILIGDTTGGGGSTPYYYELQNGWILRYSSNKEARISDGRLLEKGIPPDYYIEQEQTIENDNVLDFALTHLNN